MVAATLLGGDFAIVAAIEGVYTFLMGEKVSPLFWEYIYPFLLSAFVSPILYYFILHPMMQHRRLLGKRVAELAVAGKELAFQSDEKGKRAAELAIANEELAYQSNEKGKRAAEFQEITKLHRESMTEAKEVRELAFYDALTNLPNRRLLSDRLTQAMLASKRSGCYSALLFLDLDNFKPLNDTHGHCVGDLLLIEVANRLKNCVREIDTVARFGGDEFVVMLSELNIDKAVSTAQARIVSDIIHSSLAETYLLSISQVGRADTMINHHCTASIGVVVFISNEFSQHTILEHADAAMYQAKESGRNLIRFYGTNI